MSAVQENTANQKLPLQGAGGAAPRIIISGGGTGGHIFPAVAIANALKKVNPAVEILFVGANGRNHRVRYSGYTTQSYLEKRIVPGKIDCQHW
jgi:cysteine synthase